MKKPNDRLQYVDCAYMENKLRAEAGHPAAAANAAPASPLAPEELYALYLRFWAAKGETFDHVGFARAVAAAPNDHRHA